MSYENFIESIKIDNIEEVKSNFDIEYFRREDKYGLKPIHWACLTSNIEILEWMLQENCDIESSSRNGWRPIHFASIIGNEEMVTFLFGKDCIKDCRTDNGETVLNVAKGDCNHEFIDEILNENINLKIGLSMGLKCGKDCDHEFCLKSLIHCESYIDSNVRKKGETVISVTDSFSNRQFAIRISKIRDYDEYEKANCIGPKLNEILSNIDHSKILKFYGLIKTETNMIVFREWMNNGTLRQKIEETRPFNNNKIYRYCKDILQAIAFLHGNKILHRFIHPANTIFIDKHGGCKLGMSDFSYSLEDGDVQINDEWLRKHKKYSFAGPELVMNGILSYPYDIWLFGCTVVEMSTEGRVNFQSITFDEIEKRRIGIPDQKLKSFIRSMVMKNPTERVSANELLNHEFMRHNNYRSIFDNSLIDRKNTIHIIQSGILKETSRDEE